MVLRLLLLLLLLLPMLRRCGDDTWHGCLLVEGSRDHAPRLAAATLPEGSGRGLNRLADIVLIVQHPAPTVVGGLGGDAGGCSGDLAASPQRFQKKLPQAAETDG